MCLKGKLGFSKVGERHNYSKKAFLKLSIASIEC